VRPQRAGPLPDAMVQARIVLLVLAAVNVTSDVWLFIWAWQLKSLVLVVLGVVCLPMAIALVYGAVLACERSDVPRVEHLLQERRKTRHGWASDTPEHLSRYEPSHPKERSWLQASRK
jgi:hypothetical protein